MSAGTKATPLHPEWKLPLLDASKQAAQFEAFGVRATESERSTEQPFEVPVELDAARRRASIRCQRPLAVRDVLNAD